MPSLSLRVLGGAGWCGVLAAAVATPAAAQATITGRVVARGTDLSIGYSVVSVGIAGREQFTDADGRFTLRRIPRGVVRFTARHIGYLPFDTTLTVGARDSVALSVELSLVPARLPAVHSLAKACAHPGSTDPRVGLELATLFAQVKENAERHELLARSYPFELDVERRITKPEPALEARFVAFDTITRSSKRSWHYAPGKMLGSREYADGIWAGRWSTLTMPELADFADEVFLNNHCFDYEGTDVVDGDTLLRIDFTPAPTVHTPDVAGTLYLDRRTYQLRATLLTLVNLNRQLRDLLEGQSVRADFREAIPGVPVVDHVSSLVFPKVSDKTPPTEPSTETHRTLAIRFLNGTP